VRRAESDDISAHEFAPISVLFDLRGLRHYVDAAVCALEDEKGPASHLVLRSPDHAPAELHSAPDRDVEMGWAVSKCSMATHSR